MARQGVHPLEIMDERALVKMENTHTQYAYGEFEIQSRKVARYMFSDITLVSNFSQLYNIIYLFFFVFCIP